jgi:hypothetical protein
MVAGIDIGVPLCERMVLSTVEFRGLAILIVAQQRAVAYELFLSGLFSWWLGVGPGCRPTAAAHRHGF